MNTGKTLFAQLMDYLPWSTFSRIVTRYDGDRRIRTLSCAEQYRVMGRSGAELHGLGSKSNGKSTPGRSGRRVAAPAERSR